jgi:arylsulfatase A-like enzyme
MQGYDLADSNVTSVEGRSAEELTDDLIEWIGTIPREQSLHALINYFDPHSPWEPPPGFDELPGVEIPLQKEQDAVYINAGVRLKARQKIAMIDRYDGEIRYMDHHVGRLLEALRKVGRYDDALIIIVGDHGELFGEHGVVGHGRWLYEAVTRIPLLIHYPGGRRGGTRVESLVSQVDLLPIIAETLELQLPEGIDGLPVGTRKRLIAEAYRDPFSVSHFGDRYDRDLVALVSWPWKLIRSDGGQRELFDLETDPREVRDRTDASVDPLLERTLDDEVAALRPPAETTPATHMTPELEKSLRELGYIE